MYKKMLILMIAFLLSQTGCSTMPSEAERGTLEDTPNENGLQEDVANSTGSLNVSV